jgi:glycosyltransferase involved in cell wall biosynthesis
MSYNVRTSLGNREQTGASPKIIFLDQGVGKLIKGLVTTAALELGPVLFLTPEQKVSSVDVRLVRMPPNRTQSARERILGWAKYMLKAGWMVLVRERGRPLLFIVSNPPVSPILGVLAKKLKRQPYVLLFYDMYPEALESLRGLSRHSLVSRVWRALNALSIRHADGVITISPQLASTLRQYYPDVRTAQEIEIVPTWADTNDISPRAKAENWFAIQHGQEGKLTVFYSGNIGAVHDLTLLPAIAERLQIYDDIKFLIIGDGIGRKALESECVRLALRNVTFLPFQPEEVLPFSLTTADVSIVALAKGGEGVSMPSKTYYMMSAGSALLGISDSDSDLASVIRQHQCGVNVTPGDVAGAVEAILCFRNNPSALRRYRDNARSAAVNYYSADVCIPQMIDIIRKRL